MSTSINIIGIALMVIGVGGFLAVVLWMLYHAARIEARKGRD